MAEGALKSSHARVKDLERQLKTLRQDGYLMETVRERLLLCDELERRMGRLQEENSVLIGNRDNQHLLRYTRSANLSIRTYGITRSSGHASF